MEKLSWQIEKVINVAKSLQRCGASTGEQIAAAFVRNRMEYLPANYRHVVEAWERLDDWQKVVKKIKRDYMYLIENAG